MTLSIPIKKESVRFVINPKQIIVMKDKIEKMGNVLSGIGYGLGFSF